MERVYGAVDALIAYAKRNLELDARNADYVRNDIFRTLGLDSYPGGAEPDVTAETPESLIAALTRACVGAGVFGEEEAEARTDAVMGALMLSPAEVERRFYEVERESGSQAATEWFYRYCVKGDYVKRAKLDANPRFDSQGLTVTINLAKPEFRDPKKAQSGNATKGGYPKCSICHENEGFAGRNKRTLRTVNITLGGEPWFWQFSPYGYFNQHGIAVNYRHTPMHVDAATFDRLMDFVDRFPHYFIGCNAPLPRIGGSVLAHDHYQGGGEILPMHRAGAWKQFPVPGGIVEVVDWQGTVVRVVSGDRAVIREGAERIRRAWVARDPEHNAISPTVVKTARGYEMSCILRSNLTSEEYPDGIYHAHPEYHMIKKESIGLIEAQGLFILPGRLKRQLGALEAILAAGEDLPAEYEEFRLVYEEVRRRGGDLHTAMREELGDICNRILENTAVFKDKNETVDFLHAAGVI